MSTLKNVKNKASSAPFMIPPTLTEIRAFFRKHCGLKSKEAAKVDKSKVDYMFTIHPQKFIGLVKGRVKKEKRKRKLSLPSPQVPKKPKIQVKEENIWLLQLIVWGNCSLLVDIISFSFTHSMMLCFAFFFFFWGRGVTLRSETSKVFLGRRLVAFLREVLQGTHLQNRFAFHTITFSLSWRNFWTAGGKVVDSCCFLETDDSAIWFDLTVLCVVISKAQPRKS